MGLLAQILHSQGMCSIRETLYQHALMQRGVVIVGLKYRKYNPSIEMHKMSRSHDQSRPSYFKFPVSPSKSFAFSLLYILTRTRRNSALIALDAVYRTGICEAAVKWKQ